VISLARDLRGGLREFGQHQLRDYSSLARRSPDRDLDKDFEEIIDGQLFEPVDPVTGRSRVRPAHTGLALGMLLAREARDGCRESGRTGVERVLAEMDPVSDVDQAAAALRGACTMAWLERGYPDEARKALLHAWLCLANRDPEQWHDFAAYVPLDPAVIFDLAEEFWYGDDVYPTAREWLADAILRWRNVPPVKRLIVERSLRWLGFWHADWYRYTSPDADWMARHREAVNNNLASLESSEFRLPKRLLLPAPTANAPGIARLALLLVSHGPRLPHVPGLAAWAVSRAVMEMPDEFDEVAWCLRLNGHDPTETEVAVVRLVDDILEKGSEVGTRAARYLLSACGTPAASTRLASLPEPRRDAWGRSESLVDADPFHPATSAPEDLANVSARLMDLDPRKLCTAMSPTTEDHELETVEPILARFAPAMLADFYRRLLQTAPQREGLSLRQLGWHVPRHLLLIGPAEAAALEHARRDLLPALTTSRHDAPATEAYILLGLLAHQPADQQLAVLLKRPAAALDLLLFEHVVGVLPNDLVNDYLLRLSPHGPVHQLRRLLWILGRTAPLLNDEGRAALFPCFSHEDPSVRSLAFRLAVACNDGAVLRRHAGSQWRATPESDIREAFYGSLALIAGTHAVDYLTLRRRISPPLLGYLAARDGTDRGIAAFAEDLHALWETMRIPIPTSEDVHGVLARTQPTDRGTPEFGLISVQQLTEDALRTIRVFGRGPSAAQLERFFEQGHGHSAFDQEQEFRNRVVALIAEAQRAGRALFGREVPQYGLREVLALRPDLGERWFRALLESSARPSWDLLEFYRALCPALGATNPDLAGQIVTRLRTVSGGPTVTYTPWNVDSMTWLAFALPESDEVDAVRQTLLREAYTDELLFQLAVTAQAAGATDWLARSIRRDLIAPALWLQARALTLIGFLDEGPHLESLRADAEGRSGFLDEVAKWARSRLEKNRRARTWFGDFLGRRDPAEAWAAFRLFLRCVDRRFHLWGNEMIGAAAGLPPTWWQQVSLNEQDVRRSAEKNEGRLSETLFGHRISRNEVAPWYVAPSAAESSRT
jgi:hypothetical protein